MTRFCGAFSEWKIGVFGLMKRKAARPWLGQTRMNVRMRVEVKGCGRSGRTVVSVADHGVIVLEENRPCRSVRYSHSWQDAVEWRRRKDRGSRSAVMLEQS